jgi:hypothetical protein
MLLAAPTHKKREVRPADVFSAFRAGAQESDFCVGAIHASSDNPSKTLELYLE